MKTGKNLLPLLLVIFLLLTSCGQPLHVEAPANVTDGGNEGNVSANNSPENYSAYYFPETLQMFEKQSHLRFSIELQDNSGISISGTRKERDEQYARKKEWYHNSTENLLSRMPQSEVNVTQIDDDGFNAILTLDGFNLLLHNTEVKEILWAGPPEKEETYPRNFEVKGIEASGYSSSIFTIKGEVSYVESSFNIQVISENQIIAEGTTDSQGTFIISNLPKKNLTFAFIGDSYAHFYDLEVTSPSPLEIQFKPGVGGLVMTREVSIEFVNGTSSEAAESIIASHGGEIRKHFREQVYFVLVPENQTLVEFRLQLIDEPQIIRVSYEGVSFPV